MTLLAIPLLGLIVSLLSVFIGLGGGAILVPLFPQFFGLTVHEAVATSLLTIFFVACENTFSFHRSQLVKWPVVFYLGPASAIFAIIAAQISQHVDSQIILMVFACLLLVIVIRTLFTTVVSKNYDGDRAIGLREKILLVVGGIFTGMTAGFVGVGAGVIVSPIMIALKIVKPVQLVPTANANIAFTALAASLSLVASGHYVRWNQWGPIRWDIALGVFITAAFFSYFLRPLQNKLPFVAKSLILTIILLGIIGKTVMQLRASF